MVKHYHGWQIQPDVVSVPYKTEIHKALSTVYARGSSMLLEQEELIQGYMQNGDVCTF